MNKHNIPFVITIKYFSKLNLGYKYYRFVALIYTRIVICLNKRGRVIKYCYNLTIITANLYWIIDIDIDIGYRISDIGYDNCNCNTMLL